MTNIVNLAPHPLALYSSDTPDVVSDPEQGLIRTIPPAGAPARLEMTEQAEQKLDDVPEVDVVYGEAGALPPPKEGTVYVVSLVTGLALDRPDIRVPYREVRAPGAGGRPGAVIGCRALARPRKPATPGR